MDVGAVQSIQIRYFYFCLSHSLVGDQNGKATCKPESEIATLEICGASLSSGQKLDLILWATSVSNVFGSMPVSSSDRRNTEVFWQYLPIFVCIEPSFFAGQHIPLGTEDGEMMIFFSSSYLIAFFLFLTMSVSLVFGGQLADCWHNWFKKWRRRSCWVIIQRTMSPMNSVSWCSVLSL